MRGVTALATGIISALWLNVSSAANDLEAEQKTIPASNRYFVIKPRGSGTASGPSPQAQKTCDKDLPSTLASDDTFNMILGDKAHLLDLANLTAQQFSQWVGEATGRTESLLDALFSCDREETAEANRLAQILNEKPNKDEPSQKLSEILISVAKDQTAMKKVLEYYPVESFFPRANYILNTYVDFLTQHFDNNGENARDYLKDRTALRKNIHEAVRQEHIKLALFALKEELAETLGVEQQGMPSLDVKSIFELDAFVLHQTNFPRVMQDVNGYLAWIVANGAHEHLKKEHNMRQKSGKYQRAGGGTGDQEQVPYLGGNLTLF